ncbi:MAG: helix-turn-helix domain-containing protein, partial [bacterium]
MRDRTKHAKRRPGRPRLFDADAALEGAMRLFWSRGFAATSLDDLAHAMDMNRPSMANAFGDKEAIYR